METILKNRTFKFVALVIGLYLLWYFVFRVLLQPYTSIDLSLKHNLTLWSQTILDWFGIESKVTLATNSFTHDHIWIPGTYSAGTHIGEPCNGLQMFGLFAVLIVAFPSKIKSDWKFNYHKLWYIPLGVLTLHIINLIRIVCLILISNYNPRLLDFNHDVTFKIVVFGFMFALWMIWINKFSGLKTKSSSE